MGRIIQALGRSQPWVNVLPIPLVVQRSPATTDKDYPKGQLWLDESVDPTVIFTHTGAGEWIQQAGGGTGANSFPTDAGTAADAAGVLDILGGAGITTSGAGNTVTITADAIVATTFTSDAGSAIPAANVLSILGGVGISTSAAGSTVTVTSSLDVASSFPTDAGTAIPALNVLTILGGTGIDTAGAGSTVTVTASVDVATSFPTDTGTAIPALNVLTVLGGLGIDTSGAGSTVTITAAAAIPSSFPTDAGTAIPVANVLTVLGGTGLNTTGAGSTVTVILDVPVTVPNGGTAATTLTDGGIMLGSGVGAVTVTAQPTNGQLLIGSTGVDPVLASLLSADASVTITAGAGSIDLSVGTDLANSFVTDAGTAVPLLGVLSVTGSHGINTDGATNVLDIQIDNAIVLGDLVGLGAGVDALTLTTGDLSITSGNLNLPTTTDADNGVIEQNSLRLMHNFGTNNLFMGSEAGNFTTSGAGLNNSFGRGTLKVLSTGTHNTAMGHTVLTAVTTGAENSGFGSNALTKLIGGSSNTALGQRSLQELLSGNNNSAVGDNSGLNVLGSENVYMGALSGQANTAASNNTALGYNSLGNALAALDNIAIGHNSATAYTGTESDNLIIGNDGVAADNNVMRLGTQGAGAGQQNSAFMAGIAGVTVAGTAQTVVIDPATGELGVASGGATSWTDVTGTSDTMVAGGGYVANNAGLVSLTLPASCSLGDELKVVTKGAGFVRIVQNALQTIQFGTSTSTSGVGGSITATAVGDTVTVVCTADDEFYVMSSIGTWTVV